MIKLCAILILFIAVGCSTASQQKPEVEKPRLSGSAYEKLVRDHTKKDEKYSGLNNLYHVHVTILNSKVNGARLDRIRFYNQFDEAKASSLREKNFKEMSSYAKFFLSYYSPNKDLRKLPNAWKFYIESNGIKYPGKIKHVSEGDFQIRSIYPHLDRWSKPYFIQFPIPMNDVEKGAVKFYMTGSAGTSVFEFPPML